MTEGFGERLSRLMKERHISQGELSRRTYDESQETKQLHKAYIGEIMKGVTKPGEETMIRLAQALGYRDIGEFYSEEKPLSERPSKEEIKQIVHNGIKEYLRALNSEDIAKAHEKFSPVKNMRL